MIASARTVMTAAFARAIAPRKPMRVSEWAERHRVLSSKGSQEASAWRNDRNPPQVEIMDCFSARSPVTDVVALMPVQFGKSEIEMNVLGYTMCENPMPIIVALPAEVSLNKIIDQKLNPMIDECPAVRNVLVSTASRESSNRRTFKDFQGGQLYMEHAGNPVRLKSTSAGLVLADEFSSFANELKTGDDPAALLDGRTTAFSRAKRFKVGTPETHGACRLTELWEKSDQRRYYIACPDCGHAQPLVWSGLQWSGEGESCWYACRACDHRIHEHEKTGLIAAGNWVPENPGARMRGYQVNGLYYPIGLGLSWRELVREWLDAQGDPTRLKTFVNDRLAEAWVDSTRRHLKTNILRDRAEPYRLRLAPFGVLAITAGVDTQDNRLAVQIVGWGRGLVCWMLDYIELSGDPAEPEVWAKLTDLLNRPIEHAGGALMPVEAVAIDMGGHRTEDVKHFVRQRRVRRPMAVFGANTSSAEVLGRAKLSDVNHGGKVDRNGVHIHRVGVVDIKHRLFAWLGADADKERDARRVHISDELDETFFGGMVSETWNPRTGRYQPVRGAPRNEPLDTWVYAYSATHHQELRLHRLTNANWDDREKRLRELATARTESVDAPPASNDSRGTDAPGEVAPPAPDSRGTSLTVRQALDAAVTRVERRPLEPLQADELAAWSGAIGGSRDEQIALEALLAAMGETGVIPAACVPVELLERARVQLRGNAAAPSPPRRPQRRGVRSAGVQ